MVLFGSLPLVTVSYNLVQRIVTDGYFQKRFYTESVRSNTDRYLFMQIVADSCQYLLSNMDKYVLLRPLAFDNHVYSILGRF